MPRQFLKKLVPHPHELANRWYFRLFGSRLADPRLWSLQRRGVTGAFGAGLAICFVPLPIHTPLAALTAIVYRLNVPAIIATVYINNPFTMVPMYYAAYRLGALIVGEPVRHFGFRLSWDWLQHGLGPIWKPFLVGCLASSIICGFAGWLGLEMLWRWHVLSRRYRARPPASSPG